MALVPLAWLTVKRERRGFWWWLAAAFAVSWIPDALADFGVNPWWSSAVYPISQAGLFVIALDREATILLGLLTVTGVVAILWEGTNGPGLLLRGVAAIVVLYSAWPHPELRLMTLVAYGLGFLAWVAFARWPTVAPTGWDVRTWGSPLYWVVQSVRAASLGLFCWTNQRSTLRVA